MVMGELLKKNDTGRAKTATTRFLLPVSLTTLLSQQLTFVSQLMPNSSLTVGSCTGSRGRNSIQGEEQC